MNIAYMIWIEPLDTPILNSQVMDMLKTVKTFTLDDKFYIFAFQPIRTIRSARKAHVKIKKSLDLNNIKLIIIPALIPPIADWFNARWYLVPLIFIQTFPTLLVLVTLFNIKIMHCRSYPIMLASIAIRKIKKGTKLIFDPRSPFPEENMIKGRWTENSISYRLWKSLEKRFLNNSDITIAITDTYIIHFNKFSTNGNFEKIPNNVSTKLFFKDDDCRNSLRSSMGVKDNDIIFVYSGSFGDHWNNPIVYAKFLIYLRDLDISHRFLFITPFITKLKKVIDEYSIEPHEYLIVSAKLSEVPQYLSMADIGLNLMDNQDIRMSIKTCEYLAMSLPILVNSNVMGATEIVRKYNVGYVVDEISNINMKDIKEFLLKRTEFSVRCETVAREFFSTKEVAKKYFRTYKALNE